MVAMEAQTSSTPRDEQVLKTLMQINSPSNIFKDPMPSYRDLPPTPQLLGNVKERFLRPNMQAEEDMDEDDIRTRRYWKRWGNRAAKELVKAIEKENQHRKVKHRELVYSARVREPVYRKDSDDSDDSSDTAISLLTTSSVAHDIVKFNQTQKRKKKSTNDKENEPKVNWERFARQRTGLIDKMMRTDASALGAMVGGGMQSVDVHGRDDAFDYMAPEERSMLTKCSYRKGLHGSAKSQSTENVVTIWPKRPATGKKSSISVQPPNKSSPRTISGIPTPVMSNYLPSRGCTPTPGEAAQQLQSSKRSESALVHHFKVPASRKGSSVARDSRGQSIIENKVPDSVKKYMDGVKGLPDFEGVFSRRVRARIRRTISALGRIVGDGDELDTIAQIPDEVGRYTSEDYSRVPKYPQRVLITPQLASVIKTDIKGRMGRPRLHEIKIHDMQYFNKQNPPLDRSHRNLIIFNWLISISEDDFDMNEEPEIVDLEGELAEYKNVLKHDDVMSRAPTTLSHISGGLSDGTSAFTMSVLSDDIGDVSPNASDEDDDTKTEGERMSPGMSYLSSSRPGTSRT